MEQNRILKDVQTMARLGYWLYDHRTGKVDWSPETFHIVGLPPSEQGLNNLDFLELVLPEDRERLITLAKNTLQNTAPYEIEYQLKTLTGQIKYCREFGRPYYDAEGNQIGMYGALQDITEQVHQKAEIQANDERWRLILQGTQHGMWDADLTSSTTYYSPQWKALLGYEDQIGRAHV